MPCNHNLVYLLYSYLLHSTSSQTPISTKTTKNKLEMVMIHLKSRCRCLLWNTTSPWALVGKMVKCKWYSLVARYYVRISDGSRSVFGKRWTRVDIFLCTSKQLHTHTDLNGDGDRRVKIQKIWALIMVEEISLGRIFGICFILDTYMCYPHSVRILFIGSGSLSRIHLRGLFPPL